MTDKTGPAKKFVLDNVIQTVAGIAVAAAIPLAAQFPAAAPYLAITAGGIAFLMGKMYPEWRQSFFTGK